MTGVDWAGVEPDEYLDRVLTRLKRLHGDVDGPIVEHGRRVRIVDISLDRHEVASSSEVHVVFEMPDSYPGREFGFRFPAKNLVEPPMREYGNGEDGPPEFWSDIVWHSFAERLIAKNSPPIPETGRPGEVTWI